jgi:tetratricopeptide (TPR) repeat protein
LRLTAEKLPLLALVILAIVMTFWAQGSAIAYSRQYGLPWRLRYVPIAYVSYLGQLVCPVGLAALYPRPGLEIPLWKTGGALAILLAITAAAVIQRRRFPYVLVGWLWFLGMAVPTIGFVQLGVVAVADRNTYLPQIGLAIAIAWGAADACRAKPRARAGWALAATLVLTALAVCAWRQTWFWHDEQTLWQRALACTSNNPIAHNNLGFEFLTTGRLADAAAQYRKALAIEPTSGKALNGLGSVYRNSGQWDKAEALFRQAVAAAPGDPDGHNNLGLLLMRQGKQAEALKQFQQAVGANRAEAAGYANWAQALYEMGRFDAAVLVYRALLRLQPDDPDTHNNLGNALTVCNQLDEAIQEFQQAIRLKPNNAAAECNLAVILAARNQLPQAKAHYHRALAIDPRFARAHLELGRLLARQGRADEAMAQYRQAIRIAPRFLPARLALAAAGLAQGDFQEATEQWKAALQVKPDCLEAAGGLADLLATCPDLRYRDGAAAMGFARQADRLSGGKSPEALRSLSAAQAEMGQFSEAVATARAALELARQQHKLPLAASLESDIKDFQAGQPRRER